MGVNNSRIICAKHSTSLCQKTLTVGIDQHIQQHVMYCVDRKTRRYAAIALVCCYIGWVFLCGHFIKHYAAKLLIAKTRSDHIIKDVTSKPVESHKTMVTQHTAKLIADKRSSRKQKTKVPECILGKLPPHLDQLVDTGAPDVTIVTAYFNLGKFQKPGRNSFEPKTYMKWAESFRYLQNPTVFYTDSDKIAKTFTEIRSGFKNITKIIKLDRKNMWSFKLADRIAEIFSIPGYPKYKPNTVLANYSCSQHAKYDCLDDTVVSDYFRTKYVTWLDIGYFRYIADRKKIYRIVVPRDFNESRVAMNQVYGANMLQTTNVIIKGNHVWVGGGMVFGVPSVIKLFVQDYRQAVERFLNRKIMNTDQQIIFAMNTVNEKRIFKLKVEIQTYRADVKMDCWFYLGYSCYREIR